MKDILKLGLFAFPVAMIAAFTMAPIMRPLVNKIAQKIIIIRIIKILRKKICKKIFKLSRLYYSARLYSINIFNIK